MTKKIRLIEEDDGVATTDASVDYAAQTMKYLEAIDWKLWEILKVAKKLSGE
jgi:hypothetical protein